MGKSGNLDDALKYFSGRKLEQIKLVQEIIYYTTDFPYGKDLSCLFWTLVHTSYSTTESHNKISLFDEGVICADKVCRIADVHSRRSSIVNINRVSVEYVNDGCIVKAFSVLTYPTIYIKINHSSMLKEKFKAFYNSLNADINIRNEFIFEIILQAARDYVDNNTSFISQLQQRRTNREVIARHRVYDPDKFYMIRREGFENLDFVTFCNQARWTYEIFEELEKNEYLDKAIRMVNMLTAEDTMYEWVENVTSYIGGMFYLIMPTGRYNLYSEVLDVRCETTNETKIDELSVFTENIYLGQHLFESAGDTKTFWNVMVRIMFIAAKKYVLTGNAVLEPNNVYAAFVIDNPLDVL